MTHGSATVPDPLQRHDVGACKLNTGSLALREAPSGRSNFRHLDRGRALVHRPEGMPPHGGVLRATMRDSCGCPASSASLARAPLPLDLG